MLSWEASAVTIPLCNELQYIQLLNLLPSRYCTSRAIKGRRLSMPLEKSLYQERSREMKECVLCSSLPNMRFKSTMFSFILSYENSDETPLGSLALIQKP
jgi:hypothetical protein